MNKDDLLLTGLQEEEIDEILKYSAHYSEERLSRIKERVKTQAHEEVVPAGKKIRFRKLFVVAAAVVALLGTVLVQAKVIDLYSIYNSYFKEKTAGLAPFMQEVEGVFEYDGIQLRMLGAYRDEEEVTIFCSFTDTTGDRIKGWISLDSWEFDFESNRKDGNFLYYDEDTKTAVYALTAYATEAGRASIGETATFTLSGFKSSWEEIDQTEEDLDLYALVMAHEPETDWQPITGHGGNADMEINWDRMHLLKNEGLDIPFTGVDWEVISNIGFVDGYFHIQTMRTKDTENQLYSFGLVDEEGNDPFYTMAYNTHKEIRVNNPEAGRYRDYVFTTITDPEQLKGLRLYVKGTSFGYVMKEVQWPVSFQMPAQMDHVTWDIGQPIKISGRPITGGQVIVSPLCLKINTYTSGEEFRQYDQLSNNVFVTYKDGTTLTLDYMKKEVLSDSTEPDNEEILLKFYNLYDVIDLENMESVTINGQAFFPADR